MTVTECVQIAAERRALARRCGSLRVPSRNGWRMRLVTCLALSLVGLVTVSAVAAPVARDEVKTRTERLPPRLKGVDVEEHLKEQVPKALSFKDDLGRTVLYDQIVKSSVPTILTMNYSDCPMLCSLQLNALMA